MVSLSREKSAGRSHWAGPTPGPPSYARSIRNGTLFLLVCVVAIVALTMVASLIGFVVKPDPTVKAGPMYVTLTLTTIASLLMALLALNASYLPILPRRRVPNFQLVMWATGITGIVTGLLTLGGAVSPYVTRLVVAGVAFAFLTIQDARLARARATAPAPRAGQSAPTRQPSPRTRQRRGGRKR